ncbi:MAG: outer membrane protein assembly factor BamA [Deltaproteobacteria bacterium]|nr:MAG: outer membrane protein assembly factor BamA [Deltaproteobacteria bacterium]
MRATVRSRALAAMLAVAALAAEPAGAQPAPPASAAAALWGRRIDRVQFRGNRKVEDDAIRVNLISRAGGKLDPAKIREDVRAIWKMGFFDDVRVEAEPSDTGGVVVTFTVAEKPSVRKVYVAGNDEIELDKINEVIDLKRDEILDIAKIKRNRDKIQDLYVEKGFYLASVDYQVRPVNEAEVDVWFTIDERSKVEIREISFIGNEKVTDEELRRSIQTRVGGAMSFLTDAGIFQEEAFERDLLIIQAYYYDRGFINVKLGNPQIRLSRDKRYMYIAIPIDEGPVFSIGKIDFQGDLIGPKEDYYKRLTVRPGEIFNRSKVGQDIVRLNDYYKDKGYAYVNVTPLTSVDLEKRTVALTFEIEKGKKVYFERINIRGNTKTRDKVIRRELKIAEGELYNQTALDASRGRVMALGFFERVDVSTQRGSTDEFIEVNIEVSERPTGTFQIGAGFSSVENFIAQAQISQNNLFGRGQTLALSAQLSGLRQLFLLRFVEPYFLDTDWTFAFDLFNQTRSFGSFARTSSGGNLTWGRRLSFETRAFLTYKLESVGVTGTSGGTTFVGARALPAEASSVANLFRGGVTSSVRGSIQYDSRNNRLFPTEGFFHNAFVEIADTYTGSENIFVRYGGFARHYRPLWGPFVLKLNAEIGVVTSRDPLGVPITERYLIGGINDVRGFRPRSLGPRIRVQQQGEPGQALGTLPLGGNMQLIWNSEIEFPLFRQVGISGVVFFDAGNAFNLEQRYCGGADTDLSPKVDPCFDFPDSIIHGIRRSAGFGFRWISPIGPLRFEWGIPLDRLPDEEPLVFEFTIGNFF